MQAATGPRDAAELQALLASAARSIAQGLADRSVPSEDELPALLKDAFLAECEDASEAAAARCEELRSDLADALWEALLMHPSTAHLLEGRSAATGAFAPRVRVEVRGTAGRTITKGSFTIGSDSYCDVQVFGDATVMPLQCIVIPLPGGTAIVDLWSGGSTRATWRWKDQDPGLPVFEDPCTMAVVAPEDRIVFRVGAQTTVTLGPHHKKVAKKGSARSHVTAAAQPQPQVDQTLGAAGECRPTPDSVSKVSTACDSASSSSSSSSSSTGLPSRSRSRSCRRHPAGRPAAACS